MQELVEAVKAAGSAGLAGLIVWLIYRLVDKWAPQFLAAQKESSAAMVAAQEKTAAAMLELAQNVKGSQDQQREMLTAVRVLATEVGDLKGMIKDLAAAGVKS